MSTTTTNTTTTTSSYTKFHREHYLRNREANITRAKLFYQNNKERVKARNREKYRENKLSKAKAAAEIARLTAMLASN